MNIISALKEFAVTIRNWVDIKIQQLNTDITELENKSLFKTEQTLTSTEAMQVRNNLHTVGEYATGFTYTPYEVVETGLNTSDYNVEEVPLESVVAADGAEIYNDYNNNIATGLYSIATGYKTQATGNYSRSNGWWTRATGQCSNAEGWKTKATGIASHSEGEGTIAAGRGQTSMGKYNVNDTSSLLIVGRGSSDTDRKNAFNVDSSGNGWFAGDVYIKSASGTNKDSGSLKLATEDYVTTTVNDAFASLQEFGSIVLRSSTEGSTKKFVLTIDDDGILTTSELM